MRQGRKGLDQDKVQSNWVLTKVQHILLNKPSSRFCKALVNFQSSKTVSLDCVGCVCVAFMEECVFRGPHFIILEVPLPFLFFMVSLVISNWDIVCMQY